MTTGQWVRPDTAEDTARSWRCRHGFHNLRFVSMEPSGTYRYTRPQLEDVWYPATTAGEASVIDLVVTELETGAYADVKGHSVLLRSLDHGCVV